MTQVRKFLIDSQLDSAIIHEVKMKPFSLSAGILMGVINAEVPPQGVGLERLLTQNPSLLFYGLTGGMFSAIIYKDNLAGGRSREDALYNTKFCFINYSAGYALGYAFKKLFS